MTRFVRWLRFNLVGFVGVAVQLAALAQLNRLLHGHYLAATAAALELTLLHNFVAHQRFTWRDRGSPGSAGGRLLRFHLSNGLVSLLGNLLLMRVLVHNARFPLLLANLVAVVCCSVVNFFLGDEWVFAANAQVVATPIVPG